MKRLHSVLVVSGHQRSIDFVRALLPPNSFKPVTAVSGVGEAQRLMISNSYDIIVIDTPLPDQFGYELAVDLAKDTQSGIMLLVRNDIFDNIADRVESFGVLTVAKPISKQSFYQDIRLLAATRERLLAIETKNATLQEKMAEIRLVNRAKWALIDKMGMTEPQAHKYIEKQAMDTRMSKRDTAEAIINQYED